MLEAPAVIGGRVVVGDVRDVDRERVLDVGVDRLAVRAVAPVVERRQHPVRGDRDRCPSVRSAVVEVGIGEVVVETDDGWGAAGTAIRSVQAERGGVGGHPRASRCAASVAGREILDIAGHPDTLSGPTSPVRAPPTNPATRRPERRVPPDLPRASRRASDPRLRDPFLPMQLRSGRCQVGRVGNGLPQVVRAVGACWTSCLVSRPVREE